MPEFSGIPPAWDRDDVNAMVDHAFEKPSSWLVRKKGNNVEVLYGSGSNQAGKLAVFTGALTDAYNVFSQLEVLTSANQTIQVKHGDYIFSAKWSPSKVLRILGEGSGTRFLPSGSFDAVDTTNLRLFNVVWRDASSVDHDASFDPNMFETIMAKPESHAHYKTEQVLTNYDTTNSYVDSLIFDMRLYSKVLIHIKEIGGSNALKYNVLACIDPTIWQPLVSDQILFPSTSIALPINDAWNWVKIQVASMVTELPTKVNAFIGGKTP